jgi:hypothetical protein
MSFVNRNKVEMNDNDGNSMFGKINQVVIEYKK